jgi:ADP-ribosylglycohydrolase
MIMEITTKDRFLGCIYGLAIGDALGYPVEFMSLKEIEKILGPNGVTGFDSLKHPEIASRIRQPIGSYSDDTQMSLATANALINAKSDNLEDIMQEVVKEYISWADSPENNRYPGNTCMAGIRNLKAGMHWTNSGIPNGKGCGAAMRTAPIGLYFADDIHSLINCSQAVGSCTHKDSGAIAAGSVVAYVIRNAILYGSLINKNPSLLNNQEFIEEILNARKVSFPLKSKLEKLNQNLNYQDSRGALKKLGQGWHGDEAVAMALYCFLKSPRDYRKTVLAGTNIDGDSDSVALIAGAISGAYNGIQSIPQEWINQIENKELLRETAEKLYEKSKKNSGFN